MKRLAVDVNVILDVLLAREPHLEASTALWAAIEERRAAGLLPAHGFTTIFYLVAKRQGRPFPIEQEQSQFHRNRETVIA